MDIKKLEECLRRRCYNGMIQTPEGPDGEYCSCSIDDLAPLGEGCQDCMFVNCWPTLNFKFDKSL